MAFVDIRVLLVFVCILYKNGCYSSFHCFECTGRPHLEDCETVTECSHNEICYAEQIVTTSGHVVYNSGCKDSRNCDRFGRRQFTADDRSVNISRRNDISTCLQCCNEQFCNNQGCGEVARVPPQRGPYCYNCDTQLTALQCRTVKQCAPDEVCIVQRLAERDYEVYKSECLPRRQCNTISHLHNRTICSQCCDSDFCNTFC